MSSSVESLIAALGASRARLESELARDEAYLALKQLEAREAEGEPLLVIEAAQRRAGLEAELAANRFAVALGKLDEALGHLENRQPAPVAEPVTADPEPKQFAVNDQEAEAVTAVAAPEEPPAKPAPVAVLEPEPEPPRFALTDIKGIDTTLARQLAEIGVTGVATVARWTARDVALISQRLELGHRASAEGWIEQAAVLAAGRPTAHVLSPVRNLPIAWLPPTPVEPIEPLVAVAPTPAEPPRPRVRPRDFSRERGLDDVDWAVAMTVATAENVSGMDAGSLQRTRIYAEAVPVRPAEVEIRPRPAVVSSDDKAPARRDAGEIRDASRQFAGIIDEAAVEIRSASAAGPPVTRATRLEELRAERGRSSAADGHESFLGRMMRTFKAPRSGR